MDPIDELLTRGVADIFPARKELEKVLRSGKKLTLYQGFDPSMPNLHLGNLVGLVKLRQFQDLGHQVIFLVGDFTGMIGDPTDKTATRRQLTREEVTQNAAAWKEQAGRILKISGPNAVRWERNSTWSDRICFKDLIGITSHVTVQQLLERDFFQKRLKEGKPIHLHEFLYPIAQGYDSVAMGVDLELGGSDQIFNMLVGRTLMKAIAGKEKFVMGTKLLVDSQGDKVGKTTGNALFLNALPSDMFGGVMSFPDEVILLGFELLTLIPMAEVKKIGESLKNDPMSAKKRLAFEIVKLNYGEQKAKEAQIEFERVFQKRGEPQKMQEVSIKKQVSSIIDLLEESGLVESRGDAKRLVRQKAVSLDEETITDPQAKVNLKNGQILRIGRLRFLKIRLNS